MRMDDGKTPARCDTLNPAYSFARDRRSDPMKPDTPRHRANTPR